MSSYCIDAKKLIGAVVVVALLVWFVVYRRKSDPAPANAPKCAEAAPQVSKAVQLVTYGGLRAFLDQPDVVLLISPQRELGWMEMYFLEAATDAESKFYEDGPKFGLMNLSKPYGVNVDDKDNLSGIAQDVLDTLGIADVQRDQDGRPLPTILRRTTTGSYANDDQVINTTQFVSDRPLQSYEENPLFDWLQTLPWYG